MKMTLTNKEVEAFTNAFKTTSNQWKLAYSIVYADHTVESGIESFNTKKAAQMYDRFLRKANKDEKVDSILIGDDPMYKKDGEF